jgi:hypothetical protein
MSPRVDLIAGAREFDLRRAGLARRMEDLMTAEQTTATPRRGLRLWLFRGLILIGAGFMLLSWYSPWWGARISDLSGSDHMLMRPWGVEVMAAEIRTYANRALYAMPEFFAPLMWTYLGLCMVALAISLFVEKQFALGRFRLSLPQVLIGLVGLSYLIAVATAFVIAQIRAGAGGVAFVGSSIVPNPMTGGSTRFTGELKLGYWLAIGVGTFLVALAVLRNTIVGKARS